MSYFAFPRFFAACAAFLLPLTTYASTLCPGQHLVLQAGGFSAHQGSSQYVGIQNLIGDYFYTTQQNDQNVLLGVGYYLDGGKHPQYNWQYGINGFFLAPTTVKGKLTQENLFTNLSYQYDITNIPVYLMGKVIYPLNQHAVNLFVDGGVGANIIQTSGFSELSLDGGQTLPDHAFSGDTVIDASFTIGAGVQFAKLFNQLPVELMYRFFYLGQGSLEKAPQIKGNLNTGHSYAHALILSVAIF